MSGYGKRLFLSTILTGLGLLASGAGQAHAGYIVNLDGNAPVDVGGGLFRYDYVVSLPTGSNEQINSGDFFRIYDFAGFQASPAPITPANSSFATSMTNTVPPPLVALKNGDDPALPNITFTYNGSTPLIGGPEGTFSIFSNSGTVQLSHLKDFVGTSFNTFTNSSVDTRADVLVPVPGAVPEPAALISSGIGVILLGLGYASSLRRTRTA